MLFRNRIYYIMNWLPSKEKVDILCQPILYRWAKSSYWFCFFQDFLIAGLLRMQADCQIPNVIKAENGFILISIQKCFKNRCKAHDTVVLHRFLVSLHIRASIYMLYNAFTLFLCSPFGDPSPLYGILRIAAATAHVLEIVCNGAVWICNSGVDFDSVRLLIASPVVNRADIQAGRVLNAHAQSAVLLFHREKLHKGRITRYCHRGIFALTVK